MVGTGLAPAIVEAIDARVARLEARVAELERDQGERSLETLQDELE
jgi:hypothetical protein